MSGYGGINEIEIDDDYGYFYVHREGDDGGYWNRYSIEGESSFLDWCQSHNSESDGHSGEIDVFHLGDGERLTENELEEKQEHEEDEEEFESSYFDDWGW
jgi:hypothetical protein